MIIPLPSAVRSVAVVLCSFIFALNSAAQETDANRDKALEFLRGQIGPLGLIKSYVEEKDDFSYTYDNAMAALAFLSAGDTESAQKVLDPFINVLKPTSAGGFLDCYYGATGGSKGTLYAGPNAYLLQAMNLYFDTTGDERYNIIAKTLADFFVRIQDADGGIFGNPDVQWKSVENNCGIYSALYNYGKLHNDETYIENAKKIARFLIDECWADTHFFRGDDDPIIVTDTQSLGTLVLGTRFAKCLLWVENHTGTTFTLDKNTTVTGFDFNDDKDTVWTEGSLQMTLAFFTVNDLSNYTKYRAEMEKLIAPSGALYLASNSGSTGVNWTVEKWQAVAPTAWYVLVCNKDNILRIIE
ncbi:MAG: hypothetical protein AB1454_13400 [Candidatus Auribacterota bacterium]